MKRVLIKAGMFLLGILYCMFKCLPTQNKVTLISRQSNEINLDFKMILNEIREKHPDTKTVVLCWRIKRSYIDGIAYLLHMVRQIYHISTSKTVILDSYCIATSNLKHKKGLKIIQIWHTLGTLKKFGYSILGKKEGARREVALMMNMHKNNTHVLASAKVAAIPYSEAFNTDISNIVVIPLPRTDICFDLNAREIIRKSIFKIHPGLECLSGKKNIMYAPTFRKGCVIAYKPIVEAVDYKKFNLIIKLHSGHEVVYYTPEDMTHVKSHTGFEFLTVADYVISDYSGIIFEAAAMDKPVYSYIFDYGNYSDNRGLYINYMKEMPGPVSDSIAEIIEKIELDLSGREEYDMEKLRSFSKKYVEVPEGKTCTQSIVELVLGE